MASSFYFIATVANAHDRSVRICVSASNRTLAFADAAASLELDGFDVTQLQNVSFEQWNHKSIRLFFSVTNSGVIATESPTNPV